MDETHELIDIARQRAAEIVDLAGELLRSDADLARIHREYVSAALDQLAEAEAQALLSSAGDRSAHEVLERLLTEFERLLGKAREERARQLKRD